MSKKEQTENIISSPDLSQTEDHSLSLSFFEKGSWPSETWWMSFESEELNGLMEDALKSNPSINSVMQKLQQAQNQSIVAREQLFPLLFFDWNETWEYLSKNGLYRALNPTFPINNNLLDLTVSARYEIDFWGKYRNIFHAAVGRAKAEAAETCQVILLTTTTLAQGFFALKTSLVKEALYQKLYDVRKALFDLSVLLEDKSLYSKLPPLLFSENLLEAEKLLFASHEEVARNGYFVNLIRGTGPDTPLNVVAELPKVPPKLVIPETLSLDLLARRPDLMAQIWRVEALAHDVGAAKAEFYPNVNLVGFLGLESASFSNIFQGNSKMFGLSPAIHLPIFTAGAIKANIKAKKAEFDAAVQNYNDLVLQSAQEVATFLAFAESIFLQKHSQDEIVKRAEERYFITELRTISGLDSLFETYKFQEEVILKQLDQVTLLYNQYLASIKLIKALGGGYSAESIPLEATAVEVR